VARNHPSSRVPPKRCHVFVFCKVIPLPLVDDDVSGRSSIFGRPILHPPPSPPSLPLQTTLALHALLPFLMILVGCKLVVSWPHNSYLSAIAVERFKGVLSVRDAKKRHEASRPSTVHGGPWGLGLGAGPARPEPPEEEGARALPARVRELWSDTEETTSDGRLDQGVRGLMRLRVRVRSLHVRPAG